MAIQRDPENPRYYYDAAAAFARCGGCLDRAVRDLDRAIALNPKFALAYQERMWVRSWLNDGPGSEGDAVRLIELSPGNYWGHHAHGWGLVRQGKADEAMKEINLAIKLAPNLAARDYTIRALYGLSRARFSEAVADATMALETDPHQLDAHLARGVALFRIKQWKKALVDFEILVKVAPAYADYWTYLGEAKLAMADVEGAASDFSQALKLSPHLSNATYKRAICRLELDDLEGAGADFRDALAQPVARNYYHMGYPGAAAAHWGLGQVFAKQGKLKEALAEFDLTLRFWPDYRPRDDLPRGGEASAPRLPRRPGRLQPHP